MREMWFNQPTRKELVPVDLEKHDVILKTPHYYHGDTCLLRLSVFSF